MRYWTPLPFGFCPIRLQIFDSHLHLAMGRCLWSGLCSTSEPIRFSGDCVKEAVIAPSALSTPFSARSKSPTFCATKRITLAWSSPNCSSLCLPSWIFSAMPFSSYLSSSGTAY